MELRYKRQGECNRCGQCCVNENCEYLHFDNDITTCLIYDSEDRPERCKLFPEMPPIPKAFSKCSYWFEDTWEDNRIVKHKVS